MCVRVRVRVCGRARERTTRTAGRVMACTESVRPARGVRRTAKGDITRAAPAPMPRCRVTWPSCAARRASDDVPRPSPGRAAAAAAAVALFRRENVAATTTR